jgi:hypothetical protein
LIGKGSDQDAKNAKGGHEADHSEGVLPNVESEARFWFSRAIWRLTKPRESFQAEYWEYTRHEIQDQACE